MDQLGLLAISVFVLVMIWHKDYDRRNLFDFVLIASSITLMFYFGLEAIHEILFHDIHIKVNHYEH